MEYAVIAGYKRKAEWDKENKMIGASPIFEKQSPTNFSPPLVSGKKKDVGVEKSSIQFMK